ncbi:hypothetical protein LSAT2_013631 [Lamellibrachia satsuma]|nr:hypothetical protein LSAT2_013631 [Lamellibrachia satsuma]
MSILSAHNSRFPRIISVIILKSCQRFTFVVLPNVYLVHQWHEATPWSDVAYRCSTSTLIALKLHVMEKYGVKLPLKNNMKFSSLFYLPRLPREL